MTHNRPIPAVGLAQAILTLVDFGIKVLQKQHVVFQPSDADATPVVENAQVLQRIVDALFRMGDAIEVSELKKLGETAKGKLSEPALQLLKIAEESRELTAPLIEALLHTQAKGSFGDPRWRTAREALCASGVWKERDVTGLKKKLRAVRREVDIALLLVLRQYLDQSAETGLPVFSDTGPHTPHWEKWQNEALDAVYANEWKAKSKKHVEEFAKQVDVLIEAASEAYFCDQLFARLRFEEQDDRLHSIAAPREGTLEWVFDDQQHADEGGVLEWLGNQRGEHLFWITGRPGAGKTTLMRHLFRNERIYDYLEAWSGHAPGITSGFFFWNCGTELQKSGLGLLRSLLYESLQDIIYGPLEEDTGILRRLFADRWEQFRSYGGGLDTLSYAELLNAFNLIISESSKKFLFMIDGLDELDDPSNLVDIIPLLLSASKRENVKLLVSSRPSPAFQEAFEKRPRLWVDDHTTPDIHAFIMHSFSTDPSLLALRGNTVVQEETDIVSLLSETSSGIFLWGVLATRFLLQELTGNDNFTVLQHRAELLPSDLDELLNHILSNFSPGDLETAWKLSALVEAHGYPSLLALSLALSADEKTSLTAHPHPLKSAELQQRTDDMSHILTFQCRNLFSMFPTHALPATPSSAAPDADGVKVTYTHRCIRAFFLAAQKPASHEFDTLTAWAASNLLVLKSLAPGPGQRVWPRLAACIESALLLGQADGKEHVSYLHAALGAALAHYSPSTGSSSSLSLASSRRNAETVAAPAWALEFPDDAVGGGDLPCFPGAVTTPTALLDLAVFLNLQAYVVSKAPGLDRKTIKRAVEYSAAMRRRLGAGGEAVWLGRGDGLRLVRKEYARSRGEVEGVLEFWGQAVRWGRKAPVVEIGEVV